MSRQDKALDLHGTFLLLKAVRNDTNELRTAAGLVAGKMDRLLQTIEPYAKPNEVFYFRDLKELATTAGQDCTRALKAFDDIIRRGLQ